MLKEALALAGSFGNMRNSLGTMRNPMFLLVFDFRDQWLLHPVRGMDVSATKNLVFLRKTNLTSQAIVRLCSRLQAMFLQRVLDHGAFCSRDFSIFPLVGRSVLLPERAGRESAMPRFETAPYMVGLGVLGKPWWSEHFPATDHNFFKKSLVAWVLLAGTPTSCFLILLCNRGR